VQEPGLAGAAELVRSQVCGAMCSQQTCRSMGLPPHGLLWTTQLCAG
jgi:hypothetical protein